MPRLEVGKAAHSREVEERNVSEEQIDGYRAAFAAIPAPCLLLTPDLLITDANTAYVQAVGRVRAELVGRHVFEAFPANPNEPSASSALEASMREALASGKPDRMPLLKYDIETEPRSGRFEERWWTLVNIPVIGGDGSVRALLNAVEDVTEVVRERERSQRHRAAAEGLRLRTGQLEADLDLLARERASIAAAEALVSHRLTSLAEAALQLAAADTLDELVEVVIGKGLAALGADGGAVAVRDEAGGTIRLTLTASLGVDTQRVYGELPLDGPLPASVAARTGKAVLIPDREAGLAFAPEMAEVYATAGKVAWAALPLQAGTHVLGSVTASWDEPQAFTPADVNLMAAFAAQCAQTLHRLLVRQAEREAAAATRQLSEALQRSLLTALPQPDHLEIVARYLPAAQEAQVGGDWYDAFLVGTGDTSLVVGDVAGHDQDAAVAMAQVRNVLRGVAHATAEPPAAVLSALDRAMADLAVGVLATAVLAQVEQAEDDAQRGLRVLRWSNAGHPPPLLIHSGGAAELLSRPADLLLGLAPDAERRNHTQVLDPGATVLLYTDGLVERRAASFDDGLEWLCSVAGPLSGLPLEDLCDVLLDQLEGGVEDDVVLLAFRAHPESRPRPAEAGPERLPGQPGGDGS